MINCFNNTHFDCVNRKKDILEKISERFAGCSINDNSQTLEKACEKFLTANKNVRRSGYYYWQSISGTNIFSTSAIGSNWQSCSSDSRIALSINCGFMKDEKDQLTTIFECIHKDSTPEEVLDCLFKTSKDEKDMFFVYGLAISYYFVIDDRDQFNRKVLDAIKYGKDALKKDKSSFDLIYFDQPNVYAWRATDEEKYLSFKMRLWVAALPTNKKLLKIECSHGFQATLLSGLVDTFKSSIKNIYLNNRPDYEEAQKILKDNKISISLITDYNSDGDIDEFLDKCESSSVFLYKSMISNSYWDDSNKKIGEILKSEKKERFYEILKNYLEVEFGRKRVNRNLRIFLSCFSEKMEAAGLSYDIQNLLEGMPDNVSGELLRQFVD